MIDLKISNSGDILIDQATGDLQLTGPAGLVSDETIAATVSQLSLMAVKTEKGDFLLHEDMGSELHTLLGLPNKVSTARSGENMILSAIRGWGVTNKVIIESWPIDLNTIKYEVRISIGSPPKQLTFTLEQSLSEIQSNI